MAKIYYNDDANLANISERSVAIIGYGSQGHAHALNLRDSGCQVIVGLRKNGKSWPVAERDGFEVMTVPEATQKADVIMILINDEKQPKWMLKPCANARVLPSARISDSMARKRRSNLALVRSRA